MTPATWKLDETTGIPRTLTPGEQTRILASNAAASQRDNILTVGGVVLIIAIVCATSIGGDAVTAFFAPPDQPS